MVNASLSPEWRSVVGPLWRAGAWLLGSNIASQLLRLVSSLVLTRLLLPEHFGVMVAAQTMYFALVLFSDLGVWQSVVNHPRGDSGAFLGSAFCIQFVRGLILACLVVLLSAGLYAGSLFHLFRADATFADPRLPWMMLCFALCAVVQGAESMHIATTQRRLDTRAISKLELTSQLCGMLITISMAMLTHSVWSLIVGALVASSTRTLLSHLWLDGPTYRLQWSSLEGREILGFGKWIFLGSVIGFLAAQGEKFILGGLLDPTQFGAYAIAALLLAAVSGLSSSLNVHLIFPGLSKALRNGEVAARSMYVHLQRIVDAALCTVAGLLATMGTTVVQTLYDERYAQAGTMLQVLSFGLVAMRYQVLEQMMFARNRPALVSQANALRAFALCVLVPAGFHWGEADGAIWGVCMSQFAGWPVAWWFKHREGLLSRTSEMVWPIALLAGAGAGLILRHGLAMLSSA